MPLNVGRRGPIAPCIHNLSITCNWVVSFIAGRFSPGKYAPVTYSIGVTVSLSLSPAINLGVVKDRKISPPQKLKPLFFGGHNL